MHISISFNCYACTLGLLQGNEQCAALNMCTYNIFKCLFVQGNSKERETEKGSVYGTSSMCINESNPIMHCDKFSEKSAQDG